MRALRFLKWGAVVLACCGILIPRVRIQAADPIADDAGTVRISQFSASGSATAASTGNGKMSRTASQPAPVIRAQAPEVVDVALTAGGTLTGMVMDTAPYAVAGIGVSIYQNGQVVVSTVTNENGNFGITNMTGGVYQIVAGDGQGVFRLWAPGTNPPGAQTQAVVVTSAPGAPAEYVEEACEEEKHKGIDIITLAILGLATAALVVALANDGGGDERRAASP